jgi:DNA-directed RNA polymerase subunit RPC12/RpoP
VIDEPKLVVIHKFPNPHEAHVAKNILEDSGVDAYLLDENSSYSIGTPIVLGRYRLAISERDFKTASEIMGEFIQQNSKADPLEKIKCPKCSSTLITNRRHLSFLTILMFLLGSILLLSSKSYPYYFCKRCKYKWNENKRI